MKKVNFTSEFYKKVFKAIEDYCRENYEAEYEHSTMQVYVEDVDGYTIECSVGVTGEWCDQSFDHAFGTWHDPCPCYEFGGIESVDDVSCWDMDDDESVEFDMDEFSAQYLLKEHKGVKAGDTVNLLQKGETVAAKVVHYDSLISMFKVIIDGREMYRSSYEVVKGKVA